RAQKDPFTFLEAARRLRDRRIPARFVLPARGVELGKVRRYLRRHRLESLVDLVTAETSLAAVYRRTAVAVLPSLWEGLPYALLDALALRRPVIASALPVFEDLLRPLDPRLLFPPGSSAALAERMELWARLPRRELESLGDRGRELVRRHHDFTAWQECLREIYRTAARRPCGCR
ncbi:MAG: glycosyltransferase family 4 protein, partial [Bosea sp.]|uniref:glycosyltransferase n=1 Tax=Bosea sp. (in: a-proteobacteria) TaxID=1871050 RepID=UPI0031FED88F|nr:glycosyltransferase family 4 protein [Bosea sp. (in: a-proteobacteria)]